MSAKIIYLITKAARIIVSFSGFKGENKHTFLKIVVSSISIFLLLIITPIAAISSPGFLAKDKSNLADNSDYDFSKSVSQTQLFKDCQNVYNMVKNDYNSIIKDIVQRIKRYNPVGYTDEGLPIEPEIYVSLDMSALDVYYLVAYINIKYIDVKSDGYKFDVTESYDFFNKIISRFDYKISGQNPVYLVAYVNVHSLEEIAEICFGDDTSKQEMFIICYDVLKNNR